jgi:hypothetical protein
MVNFDNRDLPISNASDGVLLALERGDAEAALAIYTDRVQPAVSKGVPLNIVSDAAPLLWRSDACGCRTACGGRSRIMPRMQGTHSRTRIC